MRSCSAMPKARSPAPPASGSACSKAPMAERCFSTRSASCRPARRRRCCACCRKGRFAASARTSPGPFDARLVAATNRSLARRGGGAAVPSGSAVSPRRHSNRRAAAARARRGHSAAGRAVLAAVSRANRAAKRCSGRARFRHWRGMIGRATFESFKTCSRRSWSRCRRAASWARSDCRRPSHGAAQPDVARVARERAAQIRTAVRARGAGARGRPSRAGRGGAWLEPARSGETDAASSSRCLGTSSAGCC